MLCQLFEMTSHKFMLWLKIVQFVKTSWGLTPPNLALSIEFPSLNSLIMGNFFIIKITLRIFLLKIDYSPLNRYHEGCYEMH